MAKPPYVPARLVNGDKPLSARWYVVFYTWNSGTGKLQRIRDYEVNQKKTVAQRRDFARKLIFKINSDLAEGYCINPKGLAVEKVKIAIQQDKDFTIDQAIRFIMPIIKQTKRHETFTGYNSVAGLFLKFCQLAGWDQWRIRTLAQADIISFLDYIQVTGTGDIGQKKKGTNVSNTTRNNYKTALSALFTAMVDRKVLDKNIVFGIKELEEDVEGNVAYTPAQIEVLKAALVSKAPRLWHYITFMLYGFIRPAEIARLRVHMIDMGNNVINMPGSITKNHRPKRVKISGPWRAYLAEMNLQRCQANDFVFGRDLETGPVPVPKNHPGNVHREILRTLNFGDNHGVYSWKHTGVIIHYRAGIDIKTLQAQIGHQSLEETDTYLRSLNLYENKEFELKSPVI